MTQQPVDVAYVEVRPDTSKFTPDLQRNLTGAFSRLGVGFTSTLNRTLKAGAVAAGAAVTGVLTVAITKGFSRLVALDQAKVKMKTLGLSAKGVAEVMDTVRASVKNTAYGLDEAAGLATQFMAAGIKGGKPLFTMLRDVAGAAAITGDSMGNIGLIWTQVAAKGRLQGDDMMQLMARNIPVLDLLAKHYKTSASNAQEMVSKGKVSFADFAAAMHTYVGNAATDSGKTFTGAMANVKASLGRIGAGLLESTFNQIAPTFQKIITALSPVEKSAAKMGEKIGAAFKKVLDTLWSWVPTIKQVGQAISGLVDLIFKGDYTAKLRKSLGLEEDSPLIVGALNIRDKVVGAFTTIKERITGLGELLPPGIREHAGVWAGLAGAVLGVGGAFSGVSGILGRFIPFLGPLASGLGPISSMFGGIGGILKNVLMGPLGIVVGIFAGMYATSQPFRDALKNLLPPLKDLVEDLRDAFMPIIEDLARDLMPAITSAADAFAPVLSAVGDALGPLVDTLLPPFAALLDAAADSIAWLANLLGPFAPVIAGVAGAIWLVNAALGATSGLMTAFSMSLVAHPIGWLIGALALLVLAFKALWDNVEGFRNFFIAIWNGIKTAAAAVVDWFTGSVVPFFQGVWNGILTGLQWLGNLFTTIWGAIQTVVSTVINAISTAINWLWTTIIQPVFNAMVAFFSSVIMPIWNTLYATIDAVIKMITIIILALWKFVIQPTWNAIVAAIQWLGQAFNWLYTNVIKPVWDAIGNAIKWVWTTLILPVWNAIKAAINWLGAAFNWLYLNIIKPVWDAIAKAISWVWNTLILPVFNAIKAGIKWVGDAFNTAKNFIKSVWDTLTGLLKAGWDFISKYVFDPVKKGVDLVKGAFDTAVKFIGKVWDGLKAIAQAPIRFVIETVLNKGIIAGFNWLSEKVGGPHINPIPLPFAKGGVVPGYAPGIDKVSAMLAPGEAVMRPEWTRAMGGPRAIAAMNSAAVRGLLKKRRRSHEEDNLLATMSGNSGSQFGVGGLLEWINDRWENVKNAWDWVTDKASAIWKAITDPVTFIKNTLGNWVNNMPGGAGKTLAQYGVAAVNKGIDAAVAKVRALWEAFKSAFAGSNAASGPTVYPVGNARVNANFGQYPSGGYHGGIDWGVPTGTLVKAFRAGRIFASGWDTTGYGNAVRIMHANGYQSLYGHNSRLLKRIGETVAAGVGIALSGSTGRSTGPHVHFGIKRGNGPWLDPWPYLRGQAFDRGGWLRPGLSLAYNGTGAPERVIGRGEGYGPITVYMTVSVDDLAKMTKIGDFLEMLDKARVNARRVERSGVVTA